MFENDDKNEPIHQNLTYLSPYYQAPFSPCQSLAAKGNWNVFCPNQAHFRYKPEAVDINIHFPSGVPVSEHKCVRWLDWAGQWIFIWCWLTCNLAFFPFLCSITSITSSGHHLDQYGLIWSRDCYMKGVSRSTCSFSAYQRGGSKQNNMQHAWARHMKLLTRGNLVRRNYIGVYD